MDDDCKRVLLLMGVPAAVVAAFMVGCITGQRMTQWEERRDAVKAGVGRFVVDPGTDLLVFRYGCPWAKVAKEGGPPP